jgi:spore coat polysaccharide biosynthesis protein SpsF
MQIFRKATFTDMDLIFKWANDPENRVNSFNTNLINYEEHKKWFKEKLESKNTLFFIFQDNDLEIGFMRIEIENNTGTVNYSIAKEFRGKGYGSKMLSLLEIELKNYPEIKSIKAFVKLDNEFSAKIFRRLNYMEYLSFSKTLT